jgi:hypothetical protein
MTKSERIEYYEDRIGELSHMIDRQEFQLIHQKEEIFHNKNMVKLLKKQLSQITPLNSKWK